jgi:hypothetical protein
MCCTQTGSQKMSDKADKVIPETHTLMYFSQASVTNKNILKHERAKKVPPLEYDVHHKY